MNRLLSRVVAFTVLFNLLPISAQEVKKVVVSPTVSEVKMAQTQSIDNFVGHFNNKIKVVFSDIDGTIMEPNKNNPMAPAQPSAKDAAVKLREAKIPLILATGRIYPEAKNLSQRIGVKNAYLISQQGAEIRNPQGKVIYQDGIKPAEVKKIIAFLESFKKQNNMDFKIIPAVDGKFYSTEKFEIPYLWSKINKLNSFADLGDNVTSNLICIYEPNQEKIKFIQKNLKKEFPMYHVDISGPIFCDITSATATKGNAIKKLSEILGVDLKNCATLGDAENDISMLQLLKSNGGAAIAVGNAMDSVKASANFVTLPVSQGGFAKAVDAILKNNENLSH